MPTAGGKRVPRYVTTVALRGKSRTWVEGRLSPLPSTEATFEVSWRKNKKYAARFADGRVVHFGDSNYQQFLDRVPLQAFAHMNHLDESRLERYRKRFRTKIFPPSDQSQAQARRETAAWFSYYFLW